MKATKIIGVAILILIAFGLLPATRDEMKWRFAMSRDKAQDYAEYLAAWPSGRHSAEGRSRYDERSWADAKAGSTLESYRHYEQSHPTGAHLPEAHTRIENLTWQQSTNGNTIQTLEGYLKNYDTGRFAADARTRIENLTWQQSTNANSPAPLRQFLKQYPNTSLAKTAQRQLASMEEVAWQDAKSKSKIDSYKHYLGDYSDGRHVAHVMDHSVCLTEIASGQTQRLTARTNDAHAPRPEACVFSPDGKKLAYVRRVNDANQIFVASLEQDPVQTHPDSPLIK